MLKYDISFLFFSGYVSNNAVTIQKAKPINKVTYILTLDFFKKSQKNIRSVVFGFLANLIHFGAGDAIKSEKFQKALYGAPWRSPKF